MKFSILLDRHGEQICFVGQKFSELSNALCRYWRRVGKDLEWFNLGISLITFRFRMRGTRTSDWLLLAVFGVGLPLGGGFFILIFFGPLFPPPSGNPVSACELMLVWCNHIQVDVLYAELTCSAPRSGSAKNDLLCMRGQRGRIG